MCVLFVNTVFMFILSFSHNVILLCQQRGKEIGSKTNGLHIRTFKNILRIG